MSKKLCAIHGVHSFKRCPKCSQQAQKNYDTFRRDKVLIEFYSSGKWRKLRDTQLKREPLCVKCGRPATVADHIKEIKDGGEKLSLDNLQSMCNGCHTIKTADEKKKRGSR